MKIQRLQHLLLYLYQSIGATKLGRRVVVRCQTADMGCGSGQFASYKETAIFVEDKYFSD